MNTQVAIAGVNEGVVDIRDVVHRLWYEAEANRNALSELRLALVGNQEGSVSVPCAPLVAGSKLTIPPGSSQASYFEYRGIHDLTFG